MELVLNERDQASVRQLLQAEPEAGCPGLPDTAIDALAKLIPEGVVRTLPAPHAAAHLAAGNVLRLGTAADGTVSVIGPPHPHRGFSTRERALLRMLEPMITGLLHRRPRLVAAEPLSDCERRVLEVVASGASNREVAARLCISVATVRKHLEHAYRKLGVNSRTAAIAALTETSAFEAAVGADLRSSPLR